MASSEMGKTTFPSKIIEYASHGLLIVSTKVSDVPDLLDDNSAILLSEETPVCLVDAIRYIIDNVPDVLQVAKQGQQRIQTTCNYGIVGKGLAEFLQQGYLL